MESKTLVQIVTFSRILLAIVMIACFQPHPTILIISFAAMVLAYISDLADGFLARKLSVASLDGQLWDSVADKALYIAGAIAMGNQGILHPLLVWAMVFRDVFTFATRVIFYEKIELIVDLKRLSYLHCALIYITMTAGFFEMYTLIKEGDFTNLWLVNGVALLTFVSGAYPSVKFLIIKKAPASSS
ncbi:CDP-alcohol phosphatidyltransferase family protein [Rhodopseudomonas sp.]|uniref:CDP-alcohol phosphatidyltransferase family protein n=1 Tax=Rhodopseudomonas sp. TaxID=1078 RepID=UPI0039E43305